MGKKDERLAELEREHCDYFQEITTLQKVLATAEDTRSPSAVPVVVAGAPNGSDPHPPRKKRRLDTTDSASDAASKAAGAVTTVTRSSVSITESTQRSSADRLLGFSDVDVDKRYIVIKNRAKVPISLNGYYLTNDSTSKCRKNLPDRVLKPSEELRVIFGSPPAEGVREEDVVWEDGVVNARDAAILYDPFNEMLAFYRLPESRNNNCVIQ